MSYILFFTLRLADGDLLKIGTGLFSRNPFNSSSDLKYSSLIYVGRLFKMSTRLIWWESVWSVNMSWFSEINPQCSHLIFWSWFFLQKPTLCHCETLLNLRNLCSQNWHWCGRSPLWILKFIVNCLLLWKKFSTFGTFVLLIYVDSMLIFFVLAKARWICSLKVATVAIPKKHLHVYSVCGFSISFFP